VKLALVFVVACGHAMPPPTATTGANVALGSASTGTIVVTLAPNTPTPIVDGPFAITSINPGRELVFAIGACNAASLAWFSYSGGGIVVGDGQSLCARSVDSAPATHGFSGRRE
jgi:hypothetical protein